MIEFLFISFLVLLGFGAGAYVMYAYFMFGNSQCYGTLLTIQLILNDSDMSYKEKVELIADNVRNRIGDD